MTANEKIVVGLEVGTSKVCAVVGEVLEDGNILVIGVGQAPSDGVRKGEIVHMEPAVQCIQAAVSEAEESAGVEIHNVYASVTGGHIRGFTNHGVHPVVSSDREITQDDVDDVVKNAKSVRYRNGSAEHLTRRSRG